MEDPLPIEACRARVLEALAPDNQRARLVITAPTGSGKSTQVPRWCAHLSERRVVVVEPRRVACKTLAARVAELEGCALGERVGYAVRDDTTSTAATRILFMTPGIALRRMGELLEDADLVIVDELHERGMEVDLIVALLRARFRGRLLVMSATLEADRVARYLEGVHVRAEGRAYPVDVDYVPGEVLLPDPKNLGRRVTAALERAEELAGDVLVFLPGKREIADQRERLRHRPDLEVLPLHGGLSLDEQSRAFRPSERRKVVLATNVAETSITVPGVGVVIDSGLVRRTRFHRGRGFLTLLPVAADSAEQRAGRAGRTGPGRCFRLWAKAAQLTPSTPPEIRRESLLPLVLAAAASDARVEELVFLDDPADYAVEAARQEARELGALDGEGALTAAGRELFGLPLDAPLGRLLVEARARGTLHDAIDLVSVLAVGRPLFKGAPSPVDEDGLRAGGCDMTAMIRALREGHAQRDDVSAYTLAEARAHRRRHRRAFGRPRGGASDVDREALAKTALAADPRCAHVPRTRRGRVAWSNGGTEIELSRESAANVAPQRDALVVLETRALGSGHRKTRIIATCASPVKLAWLAEAGLGRERVARLKHRPDGVVAVIERVFARKVIHTREAIPEGALARSAVAALIEEGALLPAAKDAVAPRLADLRLAARLISVGLVEGTAPEVPVTPRDWLEARLAELGVESVDDAELLEHEDVLPPALPHEVASLLERELPKTVSTVDARYSVEVDVDAGEVMLRFSDGKRGAKPTRSSLPSFLGFRVRVDTGRGLVSL